MGVFLQRAALLFIKLPAGGSRGTCHRVGWTPYGIRTFVWARSKGTDDITRGTQPFGSSRKYFFIRSQQCLTLRLRHTRRSIFIRIITYRPAFRPAPFPRISYSLQAEQAPFRALCCCCCLAAADGLLAFVSVLGFISWLAAAAAGREGNPLTKVHSCERQAHSRPFGCCNYISWNKKKPNQLGIVIGYKIVPNWIGRMRVGLYWLATRGLQCRRV